MHLILPAAGLSTRFPGMQPKWMLAHPSGNMMLAEALRGLNLSDFASVHLGVLKQHIETHPCVEEIKTQFSALGIGAKAHIHIIEKPTASQPETIATILRMASLDGAIFCKDIDNYFTARITPGNCVAVAHAREAALTTPANKSYAVIKDGNIEDIAEKKIISDFFCVGGYGFASSAEFLSTFDQLKAQEHLYVSHIIGAMLRDGLRFTPLAAAHYQDWGTLEDWENFKRKAG